MPEPKSPFKRVRRTFDADNLKTICGMHETDFASTFDMQVVPTEKNKWHDADYDPFFAFKDNGSNILAVAHLDTVVGHAQRPANFVDTAAGPVVYSGALDDRLGAYTILDLLPNLGINVDVLLTTGEETGDSTAQFFNAPKNYNWMIEFDRGGTDVVMYQYEDKECVDLVRASGARTETGIYSDIAYLEHLEIKGFNWGVGYQDYHGPRSHAFLEDYWKMLGHYVNFHEANAGLYLPHEEQRYAARGGSLSWLYADDEDPCDSCGVMTQMSELTNVGAGYQICTICTGEAGVRVEDDPISDDFNIVNERLMSDSQ